jgi:hypothetical protein
MPVEKEPPRIKLIIESTAGSIERFYNLHEKIQAVKVSAMAELHMDPSTAFSLQRFHHYLCFVPLKLDTVMFLFPRILAAVLRSQSGTFNIL